MSGIWRTTQLTKDVLLGAVSGQTVTFTYDVPRNNFIHKLLVNVKNTNGSTSNTATDIEDTVTKIELIGNGNTTIKSYRGIECRRLAQERDGDLPPEVVTQAGSAVQNACFPINFGRFVHDTTYILPAKIYSTLQLKISVLFTDSTTVGWTSSATNAKVDILMEEYISADSPSSKLILKETEQRTFTTAASGEEDVKLALGNRYRKILVRAYEAAVEDGTNITDVEVRLNGGNVVPIKASWDMLQQELEVEHDARTRRKLQLYAKNNDTFDTKVSRMGLRGALARTSADGGRTAAFDAVSGDRATLSLFDSATPTAISSEEAVSANLEGDGISHCVILDFDKDNMGMDLLPTAGLSEFVVRLTQANAGANVRVVTQEVVAPAV